MPHIIRLMIILIFVASCSRTPPELTHGELALLEFPNEDLQAKVNAKMPELIAQIDVQEEHAMRVGRPLAPDEMIAAQKLGVDHPEKVRVLVTRNIPEMGGGPAVSMRMVGGLTTGYGIYLRPRFAKGDAVLFHELVHVAQFEALGREGMVRRYLTETHALPGNLIPLEREAIEKSEALLGLAGPKYAF